MKKLLLPLGMILIGAGIGSGAAYATRERSEPAQEAPPDLPDDMLADTPCGPEGEEPSADLAEPIETTAPTEYALLDKQFIVPVIENESLSAMMLVTISVEVPEGAMNTVFEKEPRLRDRLLQDMFAHANIGGFAGNFTQSDKMQVLRSDLLRSAREVVGETALDILVLDIVRQDV